MNEEDKRYMEIKMAGGWLLTVSLQSSDKYGEEKEYIEISKERSGQKRGRFMLNPKYAKDLGNALIRFADANGL